MKCNTGLKRLTHKHDITPVLEWYIAKTSITYSNITKKSVMSAQKLLNSHLESI